MALRDQPYLPLFVQDFLTDEKLMECSAAATGVYIRIMCIMHKSEDYGTILLKQKDKQSVKPLQNFAYKLAKHLPYDLPTIESSLNELIQEGCLNIDGDFLIQKRMVKDSKISIKRSESGMKGGARSREIAQAKSKASAISNAQPKDAANTEYEYEYESNVLEEDKREGVGERKEGNLFFRETRFVWNEHTELPFNVLEAAERNQYTRTQCKNTNFILEQWGVFLRERLLDPEIKKQQYRQLSDLTSYFLNFLRTKHPKKYKNGSNTSSTIGKTIEFD